MNDRTTEQELELFARGAQDAFDDKPPDQMACRAYLSYQMGWQTAVQNLYQETLTNLIKKGRVVRP